MTEPITTISLNEIVNTLDAKLQTFSIPDYAGAHNGLQVGNKSGSISRIATAVDASLETIRDAVNAKADLLIVHHGLFWAGVQAVTGVMYKKLQLLLDNDIAVYSTHLPLDAHSELGNNVLLAKALGLNPTDGFAQHKNIYIGVRGSDNIPTNELLSRVVRYSESYGGSVVTSIDTVERVTKEWAICTGGGANSDTILEARKLGIDTLIVGEGPHHTAVESAEHNICIMYAGHYATETLGVQAIGNWLSEQYNIPSTFILRPTGL